MKGSSFISIIILLLLLIFVFMFLSGYSIQFSDEGVLRAGLYRYVSKQIDRGDIVETCLPPQISAYALMRHYIKTGTCPGSAGPVTLQVVAKAPDVVQLTQTQVIVNNKALTNSATEKQDDLQHTYPAIARGTYVLNDGELWLMGNSNSSWDSRYFGSINQIQIRAIIKPIFLYEK